MNVFTTDHPLASQSEDKKSRLRSYFFGVLLVTFVLCPFFAVDFWREDISDAGNLAAAGDTPTPVWMDVLVAMVLSFFIAFLGACVFILLAAIFRKLNSKT